MPRPNKGLTRRFPLRLGPIENSIIRTNRERFAQRDITLSENDVIRFLIHRAAIEPPLTTEAALRAIDEHCAACPDCTPHDRPRCAAGIYLADCYSRVRRAEKASRP